MCLLTSGIRLGLPIAVILALISLSFAGTDNVADSHRDPSARSRYGMDLYKVAIRSSSDAQALSDINVDAVLRIADGYLVLAGMGKYEQMVNSGLECVTIAANIGRSQLALDIKHDNSNRERFPVLYEEPGLCLLRVDPRVLHMRTSADGLAPIRTQNMAITYHDPTEIADYFEKADAGSNLDSLMSLISEDSLGSYIERLQIYKGIEAGYSVSYIAGRWAKDKFYEFGYDSVVTDTFFETIDGQRRECRNIICYKIGTVYPHHQIIVGAHRDTEHDCPGADDNLSGMSGVLEIARALVGIETNMTIIFILFDAEEVGLLGSWHYANRAARQGDRIVFMLNMDMVGHYENDTEARCIGGTNTNYAQAWATLADSIPSIDIFAHSTGSSGGSDHIPFQQNGYDFAYVSEYIHSTVYHTPNDSTVYLSYDYLRRMIMASLATTCTIDASYTPEPELIISYTSPIASLITPEESFSIEVFIEEYAGGILEPGTARFHYLMDSNEYTSIAMDALGGNLFNATIPYMVCGNRVAYYVSAEDIEGNTYYYPIPEYPHQAIMATSVSVVFEDNFETSQGWEVLGDAVDGEWERWKAGDGIDIWTVPQSDYDGSGKCYLTDHADWHDVDGGTTILFSPEIDVTDGVAMVEYARWYRNDLAYPPHTETMVIYIYDRGTAIMVETVGPELQSSGGWYTNKFWVSDYFDPTYPIKLRFDASDLGFDSEVEAAIDAVRVTLFAFSPQILTEVLPDGELQVLYSHQLEALGCAPPLAWEDKNGDLAGTGLSLSTDGLLAGVAADTGQISFTALVQDTAGLFGEKTFTFYMQQPFLCGDANDDDQVNVGDAVYLIAYVFSEGAAPSPLEAGDANCDSQVNVGDAVYLIAYVFSGGAEPCCP